MANRYAVATGNWSNVATWDGGTTLPGVGDTVRPNTYTVTIDQDVTVGLLDNTTASSPAVSFGKFLVSGTRVVTANLALRGDESILIQAMQHLTINGNMTTGGTSYGSNQEAIHVFGGTLVYNGDLYAGGGNANGCIQVGTDGVATVNGTVHGSSYRSICVYQQYGELTINGDVLCDQGGSYPEAAVTSYSGKFTWTGGNTARGDGGSRPAISLLGPTVADLEGTFATPISGLTPPYTWGTESVSINPYSTGKVRIGGVSEIGGLKVAPGPGVCINSAVGFIQEYRSDANWPTSVYDQVPKYLYDRPDTGELPAPADVRVGVTYNTGLADTGTLAVPDPQFVSYGVATDDTTGTGVLSAQDIWGADPNDFEPDTIGDRLRHVSTVDTVGEQFTAALTTPQD